MPSGNAIPLLFLAAQLALALQQPPLVLRSDTRVVQIEVSVRDAQGNPVHGLPKEDFIVTDNGKPRNIELFTGDDAHPVIPAAPPLPAGVFSNRFGPRAPQGRVTAIVLDDADFEFLDLRRSKPMLFAYSVSSIFSFRRNAYTEALKAIDSLPPGDAIAIFDVTPELGIVCDYTTDRDLLRNRLRAWQSGAPATANSTANNLPALRMLDALRNVATHMSGAPGRKSLIWITPGMPSPTDLETVRYRLVPRASGKGFDTREIGYTGLHQVYDSTMRAINNANVALYPVDSRGVNYNSDQPALSGLDTNIVVMQSFAKDTGGKAYYMRNDVATAIGEAYNEATYTYELGFYLSSADFDGAFHELGVKVAGQPNLTLRYRRGYYATSSDSPATASGNQELESEILSPLDATAVGMDVKVNRVHGAKDDELELSFGLDPDMLSRDKKGNVALDEILLETDAVGKQIAKVQETLTFAVPDGLHTAHYTRTIEANQSASTLHIVVRDKTTGKTGSLTIPITAVSPAAVAGPAGPGI